MCSFNNMHGCFNSSFEISCMVNAWLTVSRCFSATVVDLVDPRQYKVKQVSQLPLGPLLNFASFHTSGKASQITFD